MTQIQAQTVESEKFKRVNKFEKALNRMFNPNEKQLILILLRVVNTSDKPTILLLDEPEISLHLMW